MPAMPPGIITVILTGRYIRPDGTPIRGQVDITTPSILTLSGADTIAAGAATVTLDENGAFSVALIATDTPDMQPEDWAYEVTERFQHAPGRSYSIQLPSSTPVVDLADIAPADPATGDYVLVQGPPGTPGSQILSGTGAPSNGSGANGDYYIDTTVGAVKIHGPKAAGVWPAGVALGGGGGAVTSVNTLTGAVVLTAASVGALPDTGVVNNGNLFLVSAAGTYRGFTFQSGAARRWVFQVDNAAESGADAGSNFDLSAWSDTNVWKATLLAGRRDNPALAVGAATFTAGAILTVNGAQALRNTTAPAAPSSGITLYAQDDLLKLKTPTATSLIGPGAASPEFTPADHGLITWTADPANLRSGGDATVSGTIYLAKVKILEAVTVTNILVGVVGTPAGLTAGQCFAGLYSAAGTRLGVTADQATAWATTGAKTMALTAPVAVTPGFYYVALLAVGTTPPQFIGGAGGSSITNVGLATAASRFLTGPTAQTSLPASITLSSGTANIGARWAALS